MTDIPADGIENLVETLKLEPIELNLFRGHASPSENFRIFGGHVIAQSLLAAYETVHERVCHSIHCYFIRPGDPSVPILYEVDRARDGSSFTTRRVVAIQHGKQIFNLAGSFQVAEPGFEHQCEAPETPPPEAFVDAAAHFAAVGDDLPEDARVKLSQPRPIEMRLGDPRGLNDKAPPRVRNWMRARAEIGPDPHLHQALLAYASDMGMIDTGMRPHGVNWRTPSVQSASLDHAVWFHRPSNFNRWHLYTQESPTAAGARAFIRGQIFDQDGQLVASVAQEGLVRPRPATA
jgi:acyl-CoA thioesterase-2